MDLLDDDDEVVTSAPAVAASRVPVPAPVPAAQPVGATGGVRNPTAPKQSLSPLSTSGKVMLEIKILFHELKNIGVRDRAIALLRMPPLLDLSLAASYKEIWNRIIKAGLVPADKSKAIHTNVQHSKLVVNGEEHATQQVFRFLRERYAVGRYPNLDNAMRQKNVPFVFNFLKQIDRDTYQEYATLFDREKKTYIKARQLGKQASSTSSGKSQPSPQIIERAIVMLLHIVKEKLPQIYKDIAIMSTSLHKNGIPPIKIMQQLVHRVKQYDQQQQVIPLFGTKYRELVALARQRQANGNQDPRVTSTSAPRVTTSTSVPHGTSTSVPAQNVTSTNEAPPSAATANNTNNDTPPLVKTEQNMNRNSSLSIPDPSSVTNKPTINQGKQAKKSAEKPETPSETKPRFPPVASMKPTDRFVTDARLLSILPQVTRARSFSTQTNPSLRIDSEVAQRIQGVTIVAGKEAELATYLDAAVEQLLRNTMTDLLQLANHRKRGTKRRLELKEPVPDAIVPQIEHLDRLSIIEHRITKERKILDLLEEAQRTQGQKQRKTGMTKASRARAELKNNLLKRETENPGSVAKDVENTVQRLITAFRTEENLAEQQWRGMGKSDNASQLQNHNKIISRDIKTLFTGNAASATTWKLAIGDRVDVTLATAPQ